MCALMEKIFGELNVRQEKFDHTILELKKFIESSSDQDKGKKMIEVVMIPLSDGHENSSMLQAQFFLLL